MPKNICTEQRGRTALMFAIEGEHAECVHALVLAGASTQIKDKVREWSYISIG